MHPESKLVALERLAMRANRPWKALWELTYRCNLHCRHCYITAEAQGMEAAEPAAVAAGLRRAGALFVVLSGGEPLYSSGFWEAVEALRKNRLAWRLLTNGTLVDAGAARELKAAGVTAVDVSIHAPPAATLLKLPGPPETAELHDFITRSSGSLGQSLAAIRYLSEAGVKVFIKHVAFALNYRYAAGIRRLADELGAGLILDTCLVRPAAGFSELVRALDYNQTLELYTRFLQVRTPSEAAAGNLCGVAGFCAAGRSTLRVRPDGTVTPCVAINETVGSITAADFADAWANAPYLRTLRDMRLDDLYECPACLDNERCVRCPGVALDESGSLLGPSLTACRQAALRRLVK